LFVQSYRKRARGQNIANGKASEAMDFIEGAKNQNVRSVADERDGGAAFKIIGVFQISFVHDHRGP
jgi:hypothetical protein